jgi:hypothetical protein
MALAYIGPETILPATSALAAAGGALLLFGRRILGFFSWIVRRVLGRKPEADLEGEHDANAAAEYQEPDTEPFPEDLEPVAPAGR